MKHFVPCLMALVLLLMVGCDEKVGLGGKVTFSDDNSPLATGTVCFETSTFLARGTIKPDGTYVVGSVSEKDGIPPGKYKVYVSGATKEIGTSKDGMPIMESLIDEKFASAANSGLEFEVTSSSKRFDFSVDRYKPGTQKKK